MSEPHYSIAELARLGGVSRRTVRYYIQRELLPAPLGLGRGKHYTQAHLDALIQIRQWQEQGDSLATIARRLTHATTAESPGTSAAPASAPVEVFQAWLRLPLDEGVELHIRTPDVEVRDVAALKQHMAQSLRAYLKAQDDAP